MKNYKMKQIIREQLAELGISCDFSGYQHIMDAVLLWQQIPQRPIHIARDIYPNIAAAAYTTEKKVAKNIYNALLRCDGAAMQRMFGQRLSVMRFIASFAEHCTAIQETEQLNHRGGK